MELPNKCPHCNVNWEEEFNAILMIRTTLDYDGEGDDSHIEDQVLECSKCHTLFRTKYELIEFNELIAVKDTNIITGQAAIDFKNIIDNPTANKAREEMFKRAREVGKNIKMKKKEMVKYNLYDGTAVRCLHCDTVYSLISLKIGSLVKNSDSRVELLCPTCDIHLITADYKEAKKYCYKE